jgi:HAMP domain-containing protein
MPGSMRLTFVAAIAAIALLYVTLWRIEIASKEAASELRRLKRRLEAELPDESVEPAAPAAPRGLAEVV